MVIVLATYTETLNFKVLPYAGVRIYFSGSLYLVHGYGYMITSLIY